MERNQVTLFDRTGHPFATAHVSMDGDHLAGTIDLAHASASLRSLFEEFEEAVNGQMFSIVDEIEDRIRLLAVKVVFANGQEMTVMDLQVFPTTGDVTFRLAEVPVAVMKSA